MQRYSPLSRRPIARIMMFLVHAGLFECFHNPQDSYMGYRIFNMRMRFLFLFLHARNTSVYSLLLQYCFTSTGTVWMATSTFTHLPTHFFNFALRPQRPYGWPPRLSHTSPHFFNFALRPQRPYGRPPRLSHTSPHFFNFALRPQRPYGLLRTGSPGHPPRLSHSC